MSRLKIVVFTDTDMVHSAYVVAGLIELANEGEIDLRFRLRHPGCGWRSRFVAMLSVGDATVAIDTHDHYAFVCPATLDACDVYYKSNFRPGVAYGDPRQAAKVRPFGPYTPCRPARERGLAARTAGSFFSYASHRSHNLGGIGLRRLPAEAARNALRWRRYRSRLPSSMYEDPFVAGPSSGERRDAPFVFFNPSCWAEPEQDPSIAALNRFRADVIRGLRRALGAAFAGGFRRNALARRQYPEAVEDRHYSHHDYLRFLKGAPVAIYTNGVSGCFSWRLVEVFASAKAIVAERLPNESGYPLDRGAGILQFDDPGALVEATVALRDSPEALEDLRRQAWRTYLERMRPAVRMRQLLLDTMSGHTDEERGAFALRTGGEGERSARDP